MAEAVNAYSRQNNIKPHSLKTAWVVRVLGHDTEASIYSPLQVSELHLVPEFSGGGGFVKILIGAVLIAASFIPGLNAFVGFSLASILLGTGISLVLGGILELLSPAPKVTANDLTGDSKYLGAPKNTTAIGTYIPIGYGRFPIYGQILSFALEADVSIVDTASRRTSNYIFGL